MFKQRQIEYFPDVVSPPGETLAETLEELGMAQAELAVRMGRAAGAKSGAGEAVQLVLYCGSARWSSSRGSK